jgi:hypothetical protein
MVDVGDASSISTTPSGAVSIGRRKWGGNTPTIRKPCSGNALTSIVLTAAGMVRPTTAASPP